METKETETGLITQQTEYAVCHPSEAARMANIMLENMGGENGTNLLDKIGMPSGKGTDFSVPGIDGDTAMKTMNVIIGLFSVWGFT